MTAPTKASILARKKMLEHRVKAMPIGEKLRLAADFCDKGERMRGNALAIAVHAVELMRKELDSKNEAAT